MTLPGPRPLRRAAGIGLGVLADRILGDPLRWHPVAGLGRSIGVAETVMYRDSRSAGTVFAVIVIGIAGGTSYLAMRAVSRWEVPLTAAVTWAVLGGTSLARIGEEMADDLTRADLDAARTLVPSLCGRDPQSLDSDGMARAALESIAENTSDATVAPLWWGAVAGVPGLVAYRSINTLDAMVGYRSPRYTRFGWASARIDDIANLVPARLAGMLAVVVGDDPRGAWRAWRCDAAAHPSPNAGVVEASFAGALGVALGGRTVYPHGVEQRPVLGSGHAPELADLRAAVRLSRRVQWSAAAVAVLIAARPWRVVRAFSRRSVG